MRPLALLLAGVLLATGCASNSYQIPTNELVRLSQMPPEQRAQRVLVSQEISATSTDPAEGVTADTQIIFFPSIQISGGSCGPGRRPCGSGGGGVNVGNGVGGGGSGGGVSTGKPGAGGAKGGVGGMSLGSGGSDGKAAAIAIIVVAAVALFAVAAVEASRFDGWVQLHPMHPVHLIGRDGSQAVMPLAWIDPQAAAWTDTAIVKPYEGPWRELDRRPLMRGGTYGVYGGYGASRSATGETGYGPSFVIQGGYFPTNEIGILANIQFAWRDNQFGGTLFDSRYSIELQALPLTAGVFHAGGYANVGLAYRWEDVPGATITGNNGSGAYGAGGMLQLELHSRIALTARAGLVAAHSARGGDFTFGISVY